MEEAEKMRLGITFERKDLEAFFDNVLVAYTLQDVFKQTAETLSNRITEFNNFLAENGRNRIDEDIVASRFKAYAKNTALETAFYKIVMEKRFDFGNVLLRLLTPEFMETVIHSNEFVKAFNVSLAEFKAANPDTSNFSVGSTIVLLTKRFSKTVPSMGPVKA